MAGQADGSIIVNTELNSEGFERGSVEMRKAVNSLSTEVSKLGPTLKKGLNGSVAAMTSFEDKLASAKSKVSDLEDRLKALSTETKPTDDFKALSADLEKVKQSLERLKDKEAELKALGVDESSKQWQRLQLQIESTTRQAREYAAELQQMKASGDALTLGADTSEYRGLASDLEAAKQALAQLEAQAAQSVSRWSQMTTLSGMVRSAFSNIATAARGMATALGTALSHPIQTVDRLLGAMASTAMGVAKSALSAVASGAKRAASGLVTLIKTGLQKTASGLKNLAVNAAKSAASLLGLGRSAKNTSSGFSSGLKTMLKYGLGIRSIYVLTNKLRSALADGMTNLKSYGGSAATALNSMTASLNTVKNALATAFAPIVTVVAPLINSLCSMLATACTYIGMFVAALTGASSFTRAKSIQTGIASAIGGTADAASDAAGAIEEEKKQLADFDDLNIIDKDDSSDSGGSGGGAGGAGADAADMFETVPIDQALLDFVERLKEAIRNGDWEGVGEILADQINAVFQRLHDLISWDNLGPTITKIVDAFCRTFNSLVDHIDWDLIGSTFAEGFNTLLHTVNLLLTGINWLALGAALATGLNALIRDLDWALLGETLGNYINAWLYGIYGFISKFDWANLGLRLAAGLTSLFQTVDWDALAAVVRAGINGVITTIYVALVNFDWAGAGTTLANCLTGIITGINWGGMGLVLGTGISSAISFIHNAITTFDWRGVGDALASFLNQMAAAINWSELGATIGDFFKGALNFLSQAIQAIDWYALGEDVRAMLVGIDWSGIVQSMLEAIGAALGGMAAFIWGFIEAAWNDVVNWWHDTAYEDGQFTIQGLLDGISDALNAIGAWIQTNIFEPFISGFKSAFGINSPSTVMAEQGGYLVAGLLEGITGAWDSITSWFSESLGSLKETLSDAWETIKTEAAEKWSATKETISDIWDSIKSATESAGETVKSAASSAWESIKSTASSIGQTISSGASSAWSSVKTFVTDNMDRAKSGASSAWESMKSTASSVGSAISSGATTYFTEVKSTITDNMDQSKSDTQSAWDEMQSTTDSAGNAISSGVSTTFSNVKTSVETNLSAANTSATTAWNNMKTTTSGKVNDIKSTVSSGFESMKNTMVNKMTSTMSAISNQDWASVGQNICNGIANGINAGWPYLNSLVSNLAQSLLASAKSSLGINSPSRLFRDEVGYFLGLGVGEGLKDSQPKVLQAVTSVTSQVAAAFRDADVAMTIGAAGDTALNALDGTLGAFADNVTSSLMDLVNSLQAIAERVSFTVPIMSTGKVVPPSTSVAVAKAANSSDTGETPLTESRLRAIIQEEMSRRSDDSTHTWVVEGSMSALARVLKVYLEKDNQRQTVRMVEGG